MPLQWLSTSSCDTFRTLVSTPRNRIINDSIRIRYGGLTGCGGPQRCGKGQNMQVKSISRENIWANKNSVLITGPSEGGLGAETATCLASGSPELLVLAGRSLGKIQPVIDRINAINPEVRTKFINLDLSSLASVREAAASITANVEKIDVLINNAAVMTCPFSKTVDGIECQFGTNHMGHFLLTNLIMPKILAAGPGARIVNLSSSAHRMADVNLDDYNFEVKAPMVAIN